MQYYLVICYILISVAAKRKETTDSSNFIAGEIQSQEQLTSCQQQKLSRNYIDSIWLQNQISDEVVLCILKFLEANPGDGFIWSMLGTSYDKRSQKQQSDYSFNQATEISGKHTVFIKEWRWIGPFVIGKTEFDGDPSAASGGIRNASKFRFDSKPALNYFSELVPNGMVKWNIVRQTRDQEIVQIRPKVDWNDLVSSLGSLGITEWQGWAVGDLMVNEDNLPLAFQCLGVARCFIGDILIAGDLYHRSQFWSPVTIARGVHTVFIPLRSKVAANFKFAVSQSSNFKVHEPSFLPDIYNGYLLPNTYLSFPVTNLMANGWLKVTKVMILDQSDGEPLDSVLVNSLYDIAPGQTRPLVVHITTETLSHDSKVTDLCKDIDIKMQIKTSEGVNNLKIILRCRSQGSSFLFTFLDHDGSVQHAAAIEPLGTCKMHTCPVILTLHGTTVPPQNQADSYKRMVKGDFEFGVQKMWLLAPTRHGAHNWEGPGTLTAMTALHALHNMTIVADWLEMKADPTMVLFAGHSMGGHGAWHLACHFPDRAIGLISLASWIKKEEYGDSNWFFRHDAATSHTDPAVKALMEACVGENDADKHVTNLKSIPVFARIGGNDRTVHPYYIRRMVRLLKETGVSVTYAELPGLEHWWWDTKETNDGGCVNDAQIRKFLDQISNSLIPVDQSESCPAGGSECGVMMTNKYTGKNLEPVTLATANPALGEGLRGVKVLQQIIPHRISTVQISIIGSSLTLLTQNVQCLLVNNVLNRGISYQDIHEFIVDRYSVQLKTKEFPVTMCISVSETGPRWEQVHDLHSQAQPGMIRGPHNYGPMRRIAERQFVIITGSMGDQSTRDRLLRHAVYIANQFFFTSDTVVPIVEDKNIDAITKESSNLIILGSPDENLLSGQYLRHLQDVKFTPGKGPQLRLGDLCSYSSPKVGFLTLAPHDQHGLVLILMGLSSQGLEDVVSLATPTIPPMARSPFSNLLPDFVITGDDIALKGPGGFMCIGFWDNSWRFSAGSSSCVCGSTSAQHLSLNQ